MAKKAHRVRNWRKYNEALRARGSISFWIDDKVIKNWHENVRNHTRGRPKKYSDTAIICGLTLRSVFNLTLRAVEGFIKSLAKRLELDIEVPDYTSLCRRQKNLTVPLPKIKLRRGEKIQILVDSTGIKVFGEGEWKVRQHGYVKHRLWRKLHLAVNGTTQEVEAFELTDLGVQDCEGFAKLVKQIKRPIKAAIGDGAFDRFSCYEAAEQEGIKLVTPPQRNAKPSRERVRNKKKASVGAVKARDAVIDRVRAVGRKAWKVEAGYHRRSLAETAVFRMKTLLSNRLRAKIIPHQKTEIAVWCLAMNKMTELGFGF